MSDKIGKIADIAPRLANLVRRLGSNHDGEVVATVQAIKRTLDAIGLDLHALADAIEAPADPNQRAKPAPKAKNEPKAWPNRRRRDNDDDLVELNGALMPWRLAIEVIIASDITVSRWEAEFLESVKAWEGQIRPKQLDTLRKIASRVRGRQHA